MNDINDVIIIGAGPVGLYAAKLLKEQDKDLDILIIEEHESIGQPRHCSGLVSTNIESLVPIPTNKDNSFVEHKVSAAILHTAAGDIRLQKPGTAAYIINRTLFDKFLANDVKSKIITAKCESISIEKDCAAIKTSRGTFKTKLVLGCDGSNSLAARAIGSRPRELLKGIMAVEKEDNSSDYVELWFDKEAAPDGFLWKIPRGTATEYGMLSGTASFELLSRFFKKDFNKDKAGYEKYGGMVPIGPGKTYSERILLIGDAAAQTKPWSGGGVVYGLTAAKIAADVTAKAIKSNDFSERFLSEYEKRWREQIGRGITLGLMFREFYKEADSKILKEFFKQLKTGKANELDMDLLGF